MDRSLLSRFKECLAGIAVPGLLMKNNSCIIWQSLRIRACVLFVGNVENISFRPTVSSFTWKWTMDRPKNAPSATYVENDFRLNIICGGTWPCIPRLNRSLVLFVALVSNAKTIYKNMWFVLIIRVLLNLCFNHFDFECFFSFFCMLDLYVHHFVIIYRCRCNSMNKIQKQIIDLWFFFLVLQRTKLLNYLNLVMVTLPFVLRSAWISLP